MKIRTTNLRFHNGFTLIEVTIAMTLLALMMVILYGAFYLGHRAVEKAEASSGKSQRLRSGEELLAGYVRSAYPYRSSPKEPSIFFSGGESRLTFISALSVGMGGRGMSQVTISWNRDGDGAGLLTLEEKTPVRPESQEDAAGYKNDVVLREGVKDFRIDYLDPRNKEERWLEEWDGKNQRVLPRAVRLTLQEESGEEVQWVFPVMMRVLAP